MKKPKNEPTNIINDIDMFAVSPTEATGLFARAPKDNADIEAYKEIFPFRADCGYIPDDEKESL